MTRPARMVLIVGIMVLVALSALFFMARKLRTAVQEAPPAPAAVSDAGYDPIPVPAIEGDTARAAAGVAETPEELQEKIAVFAEGRQAIKEWMDKYPVVRDSIQKEITDTVDTEQVVMYKYEFMEIRLARFKPLQAAGMEESEYLSIRAQYRAWRTGEGDLDPAFRAAFDAAPADVLERADLGEFEGFDY